MPFTDDWNIAIYASRPGFRFLLPWLLLVSQTVRRYNHWDCIPSDSLGWKLVSSEPVEDELFMLVYSVSPSCASFRSHQCILKTRPVAQVTSFLPSVLHNVSRLQQRSKKYRPEGQRRNKNQGWNHQGSVLMGCLSFDNTQTELSTICVNEL